MFCVFAWHDACQRASDCWSWVHLYWLVVLLSKLLTPFAQRCSQRFLKWSNRNSTTVRNVCSRATALASAFKHRCVSVVSVSISQPTRYVLHIHITHASCLTQARKHTQKFGSDHASQRVTSPLEYGFFVVGIGDGCNNWNKVEGRYNLKGSQGNTVVADRYCMFLILWNRTRICLIIRVI